MRDGEPDRARQQRAPQQGHRALDSTATTRDIAFREQHASTTTSGSGSSARAVFDAVIRNNTIARNGFGYTGTAGSTAAGILLNDSCCTEIYGNRVERQPRRDRPHPDLPPAAAPTAPTTPTTSTSTTTRSSRRALRQHLRHTGLVQWDNDGSYYTSKNNRFVNNNYVLGCYSTPFFWQDPGNAASYKSLTPRNGKPPGNDTTAPHHHLLGTLSVPQVKAPQRLVVDSRASS